MPKTKSYRWKGKIVTKAIYEKRLAQQTGGLKRRKVSTELGQSDLITNENVEQQTDVIDGRRIVGLNILGQQLWCCSCAEVLSLQYIESEIRRGLASLFLVRCHKCLVVNEICTDTHQCTIDKRKTHFDINSKAALGVLHSGLGWTHLKKLLACMNVPCPDFKTFKKYEQEVGFAAEEVAKRSCVEATALERKRTIEEAESIKKLLPEQFQSNFIINPRPENDPVPACIESDEQESPVTFNDIIRVVVSYDMGWSTRGAGRNYDSLNGFGAIVGHRSGMILDYSTCNRMCKKCDAIDQSPDHDCRKNFEGSAKAMEPHVAKKLIVDSSILRAQNVEVGVLIGDDDSTTNAVCQAASKHSLVKQSDMNHTSGGVKKRLYSIQKNHRELTKNCITYLHRCFTYAMSQNKGNSKAMADAVRNIPHHAINDHSKCGPWCGFIQDKENYDHRIIPGGIRDPELFEALREIFDKLAKNAEKYSAGASSNTNESLNATMASKAPKSRCYSKSASADFRFACAVGQKNIGEGYTQAILEKLCKSPGKHHSRHVSASQKTLQRRRQLMKTSVYKKRRMHLRKLRAALRHRKENVEGITYQSNIDLLNELAEEDKSDLEGEDNNDIAIVLLDLETSGFEINCDILQIAAKYGKNSFDVYVNPVQDISVSASQANGLTSWYGELMYNGRNVSSVPIRAALGSLHEWLTSLGKKCCIATHNLSFDGPRFMKQVIQCSLENEFSEVVYGFVDTLQVIRNSTGRKGKGTCSISGLANALSISTVGAHNAARDCVILSKILNKLKITTQQLLTNSKTFSEQTCIWNTQQRSTEILSTLAAMKNIGLSVRKKLALAELDMKTLKNSYALCGADGLAEFLEKKIKKKLQKIRKESINKIIDFLRQEKD